MRRNGFLDEPVRQSMAGPLPVVPAGAALDDLVATLDGEAGAVLVEADAGGDGAPDGPGAYHILTRSDLIAALAQAGRRRA